jgi:hypothetical protein
MKSYTIFDKTSGYIINQGSFSDYTIPFPSPKDNEILFETAYSDNHFLNNDNIPTLAPEKPLDVHVYNSYFFDRNTWTWQNVTNIDLLKTTKKDEINKERERRNTLPITYQNNTWDADPQSQRNVSAWMTTLAAGNTLPAGFTWRSYNNQDVAADQSFVNGLGAAMTLRGTQLYQTSWIKKAEIDALTTVEAVNNYDITTGW